MAIKQKLARKAVRSTAKHTAHGTLRGGGSGAVLQSGPGELRQRR